MIFKIIKILWKRFFFKEKQQGFGPVQIGDGKVRMLKSGWAIKSKPDIFTPIRPNTEEVKTLPGATNLST